MFNINELNTNGLNINGLNINKNDINTIICPHCNEYVIIDKINCGIFRHGMFKENYKQIDPHTSKELCESYFKENKIFGCGKPFKIIIIDNKYHIQICDYI
jgi:hypothetical protein